MSACMFRFYRSGGIQDGYDRVVDALCMHITMTFDEGHLMSQALKQLDAGVLSPPILQTDGYHTTPIEKMMWQMEYEAEHEQYLMQKMIFESNMDKAGYVLLHNFCSQYVKDWLQAMDFT